MSNSAGSPSTLWRLRPAIYGASQKLHCKRNINTASDNKYYALLLPYVPVGIKETKKKKKIYLNLFSRFWAADLFPKILRYKPLWAVNKMSYLIVTFKKVLLHNDIRKFLRFWFYYPVKRRAQAFSWFIRITHVYQFVRLNRPIKKNIRLNRTLEYRPGLF